MCNVFYLAGHTMIISLPFPNSAPPPSMFPAHAVPATPVLSHLAPPTPMLSHFVPPTFALLPHHGHRTVILITGIVFLVVFVVLFVWVFFGPCKQWLRTICNRGARRGYVRDIELASISSDWFLLFLHVKNKYFIVHITNSLRLECISIK